MPCDILSLKWLASHSPTRILGREPDCVSVHAESAIGLCLSTKPRCVHHFASNRAVGHSCSREAKMLVGAPRRVGRRAITHVAAAAPTWVLATRRRGWARSSMAERHPEGRVLRLRRRASWLVPASIPSVGLRRRPAPTVEQEVRVRSPASALFYFHTHITSIVEVVRV